MKIIVPLTTRGVKDKRHIRFGKSKLDQRSKLHGTPLMCGAHPRSKRKRIVPLVGDTFPRKVNQVLKVHIIIIQM